MVYGRNRDTELSEPEATIGSAVFDVSKSTKSNFFQWLSTGNAKQYSAETIIGCIDRISTYALGKKISYTDLWSITKPAVFKTIYNKLLEAKFLRITDRNTYKVFIVAGQLYLKFLKKKPWTSVITVESKVTTPEITTPRWTIKEAIFHVLETSKRGMTAKEIYEDIIKKGLYRFGAQNPVNVVRNTIEYACENSGYSNKDTKSFFRSERNSDGKKTYYLMSVKPSANAAQQINVPAVTQSDPLDNFESKEIIWGIENEREFRVWLEKERYAQKTVDNYRRAVSRIFRNYLALAQKAFYKSGTRLDATRKFTELLNSDRTFVAANSTRHHQFSAALAALERYYASGYDKNITTDVQVEKVMKASVEKKILYIDEIIDLEEGKVGIRQILTTHFQTLYGYSNISILWNAAQDSLSMFMNDNAINNSDALWRFMQEAFAGEYVLSFPHIWATVPNYPQSYVGVVINLARQFGGTVTREQIDDYFARIKQSPPINANIIRQGFIVFYANKHFILTEAINLTSDGCAAIKKSVDRLFFAEKAPYIVLRDITNEWFSSLPIIKGGLPWTPLLLQEVLRLHSDIGYRAIFSGLDGQSLDTLGAAIVASNSGINTFADVVHRFCYERNLLSKKMLTEDLRIILRGAGMLEGNELIYNLHKSLKDYRFAFTDENRMVNILER